MLGVSVDALLNGEPVEQTGRVSTGAIVEELARGNPGQAARLVQDDPQGVDMMLRAAPLARPSQMDEVVSHLSGFDFTLQQVVDLAPFVSRQVLQSILDKAGLAQVDGDVLVELAPFVARETLSRMVQQVVPGTLGLEGVVELAPFLRRETLGELLERLPKGSLSIEHVAELAPFVGRASLDQLVDRLEDPTLPGEYLAELAPFLSRASLKRAISQRKAGLSTRELIEVAPHLDRETLDAILGKGKQTVEAEDYQA